MSETAMTDERLAEIRRSHADWGQPLRSLAIEELLAEVGRLREWNNRLALESITVAARLSLLQRERVP